MGKKRIIKKSEEELLKERDRVEAAVKKEMRVAPQKSIKEGRIYLSSSYNNTFITLANHQGNVLCWKSAGSLGFKGTKKGTAFAASKVSEAFIEALKKMGIESVKIFVKGVGSGRDSALRSLANKGLEITAIKDVTPIPHNGCRPRKPRRV